MAEEQRSGQLEIQFLNAKEVVRTLIKWHLTSFEDDHQPRYFHTVDVVLTHSSTTTDLGSTKGNGVQIIENDNEKDLEITKSSKFLVSLIQNHAKTAFGEILVKLVLPAQDGYVVRADILEQRLYGYPNIQTIQGFVDAREHLQSTMSRFKATQNFSELLAMSAGGIVLDAQAGKSHEKLFSELETALHSRLSFPWLLSEPIPERTIVIVGHRSPFMMERWFKGASNLGVKVVVIGDHGSWLEDPLHADLIERFIPINMTVDRGLAQRIIDALQTNGYEVNGITTTIDIYFDAVARASITLGLPTTPIETLAISVDKHATRTLFGHDAQVLLVAGIDDLRNRIDSGGEVLKYPLIVKPSNGWSSEGVFKVTDEADLFLAVQKLEIFSPGIKIVVETYVDGPEVDANFLMWEGEILFFEVVDDFPCTADEDGAPKSANFQELEMLYPSNLSESEKDLLRTDIHKFLLSAGFRTGIFHVEARIQNSAFEYRKVDGVTDLHPKMEPQRATPRVFILEVNVRCPGWMVIWATAYTYGIDYAVFQMLTALGDGERAKALAHPFTFGAQNHCESVFVPTVRGGKLAGEPIAEELAKRRPDLMKNVVHFQTMAQPGDILPDPETGSLTFVVAFNLASSNRTEMLRIGQIIREEVRVIYE